MRWHRLLHGVARLAAFLFAGLALSSRAEQTAQFRFRHVRVVGSELRVILDTSQFVSSVFSHSSSTRDVKGWLVCVDLASTRPFAERARVYGPLWDVAGAQSSLTHEVGAVFTAVDRRAASARPFIAFDEAGNVVRIRAAAGTRDVLELSATAARWRPDGNYQSPPGGPVPDSEEDIQTLAHRHRLRRVGREVSLTETLRGNRISDPWLEAAFATYRDIPDLRNTHAWLTDDLQFLVCYPAKLWRRDDPASRSARIIKTFEWGGQTYDRSRWAFYFRRGQTEPVIFEKSPVPGAVPTDEDHPREALSLGGRLHLLSVTKSAAVLRPLEGGAALTLPVPPGDGWPYGHGQLQHDAAREELLFFGSNEFRPVGAPPPDSNVVLFRWSYGKGPMTREVAPTHELFRHTFNHYAPKRAIAIREP